MAMAAAKKPASKRNSAASCVIPPYESEISIIHFLIKVGKRMKCIKYTAKHDAATELTALLVSRILLNANNKNNAAAIVSGFVYLNIMAVKAGLSRYDAKMNTAEDANDRQA